MKLLLVGDLHGKLSDLPDLEAFERFLYEAVEEKQPDRTVFLGDQYDTHGIVHVKVQAYYRRMFKNLVQMTDVSALVGNHDMPADRFTGAHAMQAHEDVIDVVDWFTERDGVFYMSYCGSGLTNESFELNVESAKTLICHETFQGATYDNGFYAKDGIDPESLPFDNIISGHIHKPSTFGKVWYPGSPRWLTVSDANVKRGVFLLDTETWDIEMIPTDDVLSKVWHLTETPESDQGCAHRLETIKPNDRVVVDIQGPASFIEERRKLFSRPGVRIRTFPTDQRAARVSEVEGVPAAFRKYVTTYEPRFGTPKDKLVATIDERLHV